MPIGVSAPNWLKEFPGAFWDTIVGNAKENFPEFIGEVKSGVTTIAKGTGEVLKVVVSPLKTPLILIAVIAFIGLIYWKRISKIVGI